MAKPRDHLRNPPIEEAIVEFRVRPREGTTLQDLAPLRELLAVKYPQITELRELQFLAGVDSGQQFSSQGQRLMGWLLRSQDNRYAVRVCGDNFAFSQLRPYTCWEDVVAVAFPLWTRYVEASRPVEVARLGVRYINKIEVPRVRFGVYLEAPPTPPELAPLEIPQFLTRITFNDTELSCQGTVTQANGPVPPPDRMQLLLDIDAFREGPWPAEAIHAASLEPLRKLKNKLFFAHLTDAAVARYE
ncbi:MAG: TIGR04255 family protein [Terriglobales bacterium]